MNKYFLIISLTTCLASTSVQSAVYKYVDKYGNTSFSNNPTNSKQKKEVIINTPNSIHIPIIPPNKNIKKKKKVSRLTYKSLVLTEPLNESTFHGFKPIIITAKSVPELYKNHSLKLIVDGKTIGHPQRSMDFVLRDTYRGKHKIAVQIVDVSGKMIKETSIKIYVFKPIIKKNKLKDLKPMPQ